MIRLCKSILFCLLFLGALYSTWIHLSNMTIKDVNDWLRIKEQKDISADGNLMLKDLFIFPG
ncbi:hypothetical protein [Halobacillus sp. Marseille-Q1614]|uniref:hypothetical protein n=1 Tax=Halobacillus sp. Marseille-Q1614 TaxID=2709134 RepID=UPI00156FCE83|nr:hypothetical protein [Halobacillus sp. Marseille-Q1614]